MEILWPYQYTPGKLKCIILLLHEISGLTLFRFMGIHFNKLHESAHKCIPMSLAMEYVIGPIALAKVEYNGGNTTVVWYMGLDPRKMMDVQGRVRRVQQQSQAS